MPLKVKGRTWAASIFSTAGPKPHRTNADTCTLPSIEELYRRSQQDTAYMDAIRFVQHVPRKRADAGLDLQSATPATRLLETRRQTFEVQEALELQKTEFAKREKNFADREETLKRKDIELQKSLIRFSRFLQDNDAKRVRALKKAADERKTCEEKEREITETQKELSEVKAQTRKTKGALTRFLRYEEYLGDVIDASKEFHEVSEVMSRHATLRATNVDLRQQQHRVTDAAEESRLAQQAELQPKAMEAQMLRDTVLVLNQELVRAASERHALEVAWEAARAAALQSLTEHGQVYMTIDNLHERRSGCSSIRLAPNISLLAKIQGLCNFITDVGALRAQAADVRHEELHTVKSYLVAPLLARSRQSVATVA